MAAKKNIPRKVDLSKQMENARTDARVDTSGESGVRILAKTQRGTRFGGDSIFVFLHRVMFMVHTQHRPAPQHGCYQV